MVSAISAIFGGRLVTMAVMKGWTACVLIARKTDHQRVFSSMRNAKVWAGSPGRETDWEHGLVSNFWQKEVTRLPLKAKEVADQSLFVAGKVKITSKSDSFSVRDDLHWTGAAT